MKEIEAKIIEINPGQVISRLEGLQAAFEFRSRFAAAYFDKDGGALKQTGQVLRLRMEGDRAVLTYKALLGQQVDGIKIREEHEVAVSDYFTMATIIKSLGYTPVLEIIKTRTQYLLHGAHVVIDEFEGEHAHIPPLMEIEAASVEKLGEIAVLLGYQPTDLKNWSVAELLAHYG